MVAPEAPQPVSVPGGRCGRTVLERQGVGGGIDSGPVYSHAALHAEAAAAVEDLAGPQPPYHPERLLHHVELGP
jgi:hypothetical protein